MRKSTWFPMLLGCLLAYAGNARSADFSEALTTDRPDAAESSLTVGKHRFQLETSFQIAHNRNAGTTTDTMSTPTLLRLGLWPHLELRMEGELFAIQTSSAAPAQKGFTDLALGFKIHFLENSGLIPSAGFLAHVNIPTGVAAFTADAAEPEFKLLADWDLPYGFGLGTNWGIDIPVRDAMGNKFARFLYAAALGHAMPVASERFNFFVEFTGAIPVRSNKSDEHAFDTGLTWLFTENSQMDVSVSIGLNNTTDDVVTGLGFSHRFQ